MEKRKRVYVSLRALWGNGDAESTIKVSRKKWSDINKGGKYQTSTWSWYDGRRQVVGWKFGKGLVSINGEDGMQCVVDLPVDSLFEDIIHAK